MKIGGKMQEWKIEPNKTCTISGKTEEIYGHNDRQKLDHYFVNFDSEGIINIGSEDIHGQGGIELERPFMKSALAKKNSTNSW